MGEAALQLVKNDEVMKEVISVEDQAKALKVIDSPSYISAGELWKAIKGIRAKVAETFDANIKKAHELHKSLVAEKKRHDGPLDEAERMVKGAMNRFDQEQERLRREEQARLEAIARKAEEDRRLQEAIEAEAAMKAQGASQEEVAQETAAILETPVSVAPVVLPKATPKLQGGPVYREVWSAEITDIKSLCRAVAEGRASTEFVMGNMPALNKMATALKQTMNIPGVRAVSRRV